MVIRGSQRENRQVRSECRLTRENRQVRVNTGSQRESRQVTGLITGLQRERPDRSGVN